MPYDAATRDAHRSWRRGTWTRAGIAAGAVAAAVFVHCGLPML